MLTETEREALLRAAAYFSGRPYAKIGRTPRDERQRKRRQRERPEVREREAARKRAARAA